MKKTLLLIASAAMLLVGCAKEELGPEASSGEMVTANFTAQMQRMPQTRSVTDGEDTKANRCVMEIYYKGVLYTRDVQPISGMKATFTPKLVSNRTYDVLFWADCGDNLADKYYTTDAEGLGLQAVEMKATAYTANDDARDAFYTTESVEVLQQVSTEEFELTRPFAQVNIITTDAAIIKNDNLYPDGVKMVYTAPTKFNLLTETLSEEKELTVTGIPYEAFNATSTALTLEMDYLFTSVDKSALDIAFEASKTGESTVTSHSFTNIPVQRNYRTNIKGALLTTTGQWTATIVSDWNQPDEEVKYVEEGSIAAANQALAEGKTAILIKSPADAEIPIVIPAVADGKNISIKTEGTNGKTLTFNGATGPANLYIASDAKELVINTQKTHVEVNSGAYTKVTAETSATTLVIAKGVTVETLEVNKGNVEIHGVVNALTRANGVKAEMYASDRATLINYINWAKAGDIAGLECDIDLAGENWTPLRQGNNRYTATFDGQGHTISNMTISTDMANGVGFFSDMTGGAVIKNFTMTGANISNTTNNSDKGNMWGIISGYAYGNVTFENIVVKNSKIHAFGKVAGILGMAADPNGTTVVKNCKVEDTEIIGCYNVANYVGLVQNAIVLEGCTSTNVEKKLGGRYGEESYVTFDNVKVINKDTENPKYVLSSGKYWEYAPGSYYAAFADCYNDIHYLEWKALDGTVDALVFNTPDTPELHDLEPVAIIGSKKYYDLPTAFAAAQAGETLEIVQAGEYTLPATLPNITVSGNVADIVFNCVGSGSIASISNGATFKNVTMNFGQSGYHGFQHAGHIIMEECILNGIFFSYGDMTFNGCTFNQENEDYNMWTYAGDITYNGCTFNSKGKFLNLYRESATEYDIVAKDCVFNTSKKNKAALNIKETCGAIFLKYNVTIENCSCNELQNTLENKDDGTLYRVSPIWQVDDRNDGAAGINVTVDGVKLYPFYSQDANGNFHVANAKGLLSIAKDMNKSLEKFYYKTIFLDADIDLANAAWTPIAGGWSGDYSVNFDGQNHEIKNVAIDANGSKNAAFFGNWAGYIKNLTLNKITVTGGDKRTAALVGQMVGDIENCHVINANIQSANYKVGGLVGSVTAGTSTIKNCSVKNSSIEGLEQVGGFCGSLGTGDGGAAKFIGNVVENITITTSNPASAKANTFGAYVGTYYKDGFVAENTNNTISGTNNIYSANEGFGILLVQ